VDVLERLREHVNIVGIYSHQETGEYLTYQRDIAVSHWAAKQGILWYEFRQFGVIRRLKTRNIWAASWKAQMSEPITPTPQKITSIDPTLVLESSDLFTHSLPSNTVYKNITDRPLRQTGGEALAHELLESFLATRGKFYSKHMSSPGTADVSCSRLSPYITYGCISLKQVYQRVQYERQHVDAIHGSQAKQWARSLKSFEKRLYWHCHFMQKLEDQPSIEWAAMHPMYEGVRDTDAAAIERFNSFKRAETGVPIIDSCLRYLFAGGWINFRMRAMLMSFATYQLWIPWQWAGQFLAREFIDFESGIHYYQSQMQSGETGINPLRIYSPLKQSKDQDPDGAFIKRWCPELETLPLPYLHAPETLPPLLAIDSGFVLGEHYPAPIINLKERYDAAKDRLYTLRKDPEHQRHCETILRKHVARAPIARLVSDV